MDLQHKLAVILAGVLDESNENREEHVLLTYGIEIFLNEFLKILLVMLIAAFLRKTELALLFVSYLLVARKFSGGRHCKSNFMCMLVTFITAFLAPVMATMVKIPIWGIIGITFLEIILICIFVPYTKPEECITQEQREKNRRLAIILFLIFGFVAWLAGGMSYVNGILVEEGIVILATLKIKGNGILCEKRMLQ